MDTVAVIGRINSSSFGQNKIRKSIAKNLRRYRRRRSSLRWSPPQSTFADQRPSGDPTETFDTPAKTSLPRRSPWLSEPACNIDLSAFCLLLTIVRKNIILERKYKQSCQSCQGLAMGGGARISATPIKSSPYGVAERVLGWLAGGGTDSKLAFV